MALPGKDGKVTLGANTIIGMGTWNIDGITTEEFDASDFGDNWKSYEYGMNDGGTVSFNGHFEPTDVTGQRMLEKANLYNSKLTTLRFYFNNTSYYEACQSTGWFGPGADSTGFPTVASSICITTVTIGTDKSGLGTISFTGKVSGLMVRAV